jgi:cytochrome d ubiquinol oxidase subunit I
LPQTANQLGWISAEVGRQPWIVYNLLRTSDALSKVVTEGQIWFSILLFILIYTLLFVLFLYLLNEKIKHGPEPVDSTSAVYAQQKGLFNKENRSH